MSLWTLFSNHGHVLVCLSRDPHARLRDVAAEVGITERAVQKIVRDLQDGQMLSVTKSGRRNSYRINDKQTLRHALEDKCTLKELLKVINKAQKRGMKRTSTRQADESGLTRKRKDEETVRVSINAGISPAPQTESVAEDPVQQVSAEDKGKAEPEKPEDPGKKKERQSPESQKKSKPAKKASTQQGSLF